VGNLLARWLSSRHPSSAAGTAAVSHAQPDSLMQQHFAWLRNFSQRIAEAQHNLRRGDDHRDAISAASLAATMPPPRTSGPSGSSASSFEPAATQQFPSAVETALSPHHQPHLSLSSSMPLTVGGGSAAVVPATDSLVLPSATVQAGSGAQKDIVIRISLDRQ